MTTGSDGTTSDLLQAITDDLTTLLRQEFQRAQDELAGKARQAGRGAALLGAAGALGALAAGTSAATLVRLLDQALPRPASALLATTLYGAGAAGLGYAGWTEVRRALPAAPRETMSSLREDARAARPGADVADGYAGRAGS